jgi:hypothetical protein
MFFNTTFPCNRRKCEPESQGIGLLVLFSIDTEDYLKQMLLKNYISSFTFLNTFLLVWRGHCNIAICTCIIPRFTSSPHYSPSYYSICLLRWLQQVSMFHIHSCIESTSTTFTVFTFFIYPFLPTSALPLSWLVLYSRPHCFSFKQVLLRAKDYPKDTVSSKQRSQCSVAEVLDTAAYHIAIMS